MTQAEKRRFIRELAANVVRSVIEAVPKMPDEWDGHELRRFLADKFDESAMTIGRPGPYGRPYARRTREYRNAVNVLGL